MSPRTKQNDGGFRVGAGHDPARVILEKLKRTGRMPDLEERIVFESVLTPQDIRDRYQALHRAIYGLASHGRFLGTLKPGNRTPDLRGSCLAGGSAHPGPGLPTFLMGGWLAADTLDREGLRATGRARHSRAGAVFTPA
jgi:diapolycopene oxygenase